MKLDNLGFVEGMINDMLGLAAADRPKVFDWDGAAKLIKQHNIRNATAGLAEDWFWTSRAILKDGEIMPRHRASACLASSWATPVLVDDGTDDIYPCYVHDTPEENPNGWNSGTYWPESALATLRGNPGPEPAVIDPEKKGQI